MAAESDGEAALGSKPAASTAPDFSLQTNQNRPATLSIEAAPSGGGMANVSAP